MKIPQNLVAVLAVLAPAVWALPHPTDVVAVVTTTEIIARGAAIASQTGFRARDATSQAGTVTEAPTTTASTSSSVGFTGPCDYSYCESGSKVCFHWAGYTSWDISRGPIPGEVPTIIGTC